MSLFNVFCLFFRSILSYLLITLELNRQSISHRVNVNIEEIFFLRNKKLFLMIAIQFNDGIETRLDAKKSLSRESDQLFHNNDSDDREVISPFLLSFFHA